MSEIDKLADIFSRRLEGARQAQLRFVICKSVDWGEKTMTATGVSDDVDYEGVQLGFGYVDIKPKPDTVCLIGILEGKEALTFLVNAEEVELVEVKAGTVIFNGGELGFVKSDALVRKLNALEDGLGDLKKVFNSWVVVPNDGGTALKSAAAAWAGQTITKTGRTDIEDEKLLHG
jgi:hypothetical protein